MTHLFSEIVKFLSIANIKLISIGLILLYCVPIPWKCRKKMGFIQAFSLLGATGSALNSIKAFLTTVLALFILNKDRLEIREIPGGELEYVYFAGGSFGIAWVAGIAIVKILKDRYSVI